MNIIFAGTPEFAVPTLKALLASKHSVIAVYAQPDRPSGRGQKLIPSPVKQCAEQHQLPVYQPLTLRDEAAQQQIKTLTPDLMVVVAYGLILPKVVLELPRWGCMNVHASLLPKWRGAAPIQHAILAGDPETGVTIMQMDQGLDTGAMLKKISCKITEQDTTQTLMQKLAELGAEALIQTLDLLENNELQPVPQDNHLVTYAAKIEKAHAKLDWQESAENLGRKVRAYNPWPVAYALFNEANLRIWQAEVVSGENTAKPGTIISASKQGIDVATGGGILRILQAQLPGGRVLSAAELINAQKALGVGALLL